MVFASARMVENSILEPEDTFKKGQQYSHSSTCRNFIDMHTLEFKFQSMHMDKVSGDARMRAHRAQHLNGISSYQQMTRKTE